MAQVDYTINRTAAAQDAWTFPAQVSDPVLYSSEWAARITAKYFGKPVLDELLALIYSRVASKTYSKLWTCLAGLNVGDPVYISATDTVTLALATTEPTSRVVGFVRSKPSTTTCYLEHYLLKTGLSGLTAGNPVYLTDAGGFGAAAGTVSKTIGYAIDTDEALLSASPSPGGTGDHGALSGLADDDHTQYLLAAGTRALSAAWDAGSWQIRAETFQSDVATGTAPFTVASATVVTNLNADTVDGSHASAFATSAHLHDGQTLECDGIQSDAPVFVINESGGDYNFRIEGDAEQNLFFIDAGTDRAGFGTGAPSARVSIQGTQNTATLAGELVTNGTFDSDLSGWTAGANWSWSGGVALHASGSAETLSQNISVTSGATYLIEFVVTGSNSVSVSLGSVSLIRTGTVTTFPAGTYSRTLVAAASGSVAFTITPGSTFAGTIDSITVKRLTLGSVPSDFDILNTNGTVGLEGRSGGAGLQNIFLGTNCGSSVYSGTGNLGIGYNALRYLTTGYTNVALGVNSLTNLNVGYQNFALGSNALAACTAGFENTGIGYFSLYNCTVGSGNIAIGSTCSYSATTALNNTAIGTSALRSMVTSSSNVAIGTDALRTCTGSFNTAVGTNAGRSGVAVSNVACLGYYAGYYQTASSQVTIDTLNRSTLAGEDAYSLIRGTVSTTPASQLLWFNAADVAIRPNAASGETPTLSIYGYPTGESKQKATMGMKAATDGVFLFSAATDVNQFAFDTSVDVTGNITVSGTVDGRDLAADGIKLDGICGFREALLARSMIV